MKNFLFMLILALVALVASPPQSAQCSTVAPIMAVVADAGLSATVATDAVVQSTDFETSLQSENLPPPEVGLKDVIKTPKKTDPVGDWIYWALGAFVWVFYNIVVRIIPTSKSWTIVAILYRISNFFVKDRATGGGTLTIKKV